MQSGKISRTGNLCSQITDYVKASNVNIGKYVTPTDVLFEIVNKDDVHLALNAFIGDLTKSGKGKLSSSHWPAKIITSALLRYSW